MNTEISFNRFGRSLILSANGMIKFLNSVIIENNRYKAIVQLYFSVLRFQGYGEFSNNNTLFILESTGGSYYIVKEYSTINITKNSVYTVMQGNVVLNDESKPICPFQFISNLHGDPTKNISENGSLNYHIYLLDNVHYEPKYLVQESNLSYKDCSWLKDTAFSSTNSSVVFNKVLRNTIEYPNTTKTRYLTICPCSNISAYNCSQSYI